MGHLRWELAGTEMGKEFTTRDVTSKAGTARKGDGKRNLPQEMGHPRWELADREMGRGIYRRRWDIQGRRIYHMTWDFQDRNWQVGRREEDLPREVGHPRWEVAGREMGRGIYHSRWELAGRETGRGIYRRRWDIRDIQGRRIYHMTWDFQGRNWQAGRREEEFTT